MSDEKNAIVEQHFSPDLRRHFESHVAFQANYELPQHLRNKLAELDHAEARELPDKQSD